MNYQKMCLSLSIKMCYNALKIKYIAHANIEVHVKSVLGQAKKAIIDNGGIVCVVCVCVPPAVCHSAFNYASLYMYWKLRAA